MRNSRTHIAMVGGHNFTAEVREQYDFYATPPKAVELLLDKECFSRRIWEPACGEGHISKVLTARGYDVTSTDLIDRGYGRGGVDFLMVSDSFDGDIVTNPPFRFAQQFVEHSLDTITAGHKVAMYMRVQFLESESRRELFECDPPARVYVAHGRFGCARNGEWEKQSSSAMMFAWFIWEKGFKGDPVLKWFD